MDEDETFWAFRDAILGWVARYDAKWKTYYLNYAVYRLDKLASAARKAYVAELLARPYAKARNRKPGKFET